MHAKHAHIKMKLCSTNVIVISSVVLSLPFQVVPDDKGGIVFTFIFPFRLKMYIVPKVV